MTSGGISESVPPVRDAQGNFDSRNIVELVASEIHPSFFPDFLSVSSSDILRVQSDGIVQNPLEIGANDDALYINDVNDVACMNEKCNKRISVAGQEWSVGRPGNRPIGAREAARNSQTCLGPYATHATVQPHTGRNTHEDPALSRQLPRLRDQHLI